jgi:hypothetical protein
MASCFYVLGAFLPSLPGWCRDAHLGIKTEPDLQWCMPCGVTHLSNMSEQQRTGEGNESKTKSSGTLVSQVSTVSENPFYAGQSKGQRSEAQSPVRESTGAAIVVLS